ncbi:helix-turn-helix domain-containing protein [Macrococcus carouselicus]|nr:helix-turn-helix domain-containing protein [Macrococcus carouselicus]
MDSIYQQAKVRKFAEKTDKSFNNIITGFKSHQTFFDAMMQSMLPFYNSNPERTGDAAEPLQFYPYFYESSQLTFQALRLLTQTISARSSEVRDFYPVSNHLYIHQQIKYWISAHGMDASIYQRELLMLFDELAAERSVISYKLLPDAQGNHYTVDEICQADELTLDEYRLKVLHEMNHLTAFISEHEYFKELYIRLPLQIATEQTRSLMESGVNLEEIAAARQVKLHTIEDHIIEMVIKDYEIDYTTFVAEDEIAAVRNLYSTYQFQRLKPYYQESGIDSYFKIKLALCLTMKGVKK